MTEPKDDEAALWQALINGHTPRDAAVKLRIPHKRVTYLCEKWARQGKYEYGVSIDLGWPTP